MEKFRFLWRGEHKHTDRFLEMAISDSADVVAIMYGVSVNFYAMSDGKELPENDEYFRPHMAFNVVLKQSTAYPIRNRYLAPSTIDKMVITGPDGQLGVVGDVEDFNLNLQRSGIIAGDNIAMHTYNRSVLIINWKTRRTFEISRTVLRDHDVYMTSKYIMFREDEDYICHIRIYDATTYNLLNSYDIEQNVYQDFIDKIMLSDDMRYLFYLYRNILYMTDRWTNISVRLMDGVASFETRGKFLLLRTDAFLVYDISIPATGGSLFGAAALKLRETGQLEGLRRPGVPDDIIRNLQEDLRLEF